MRESCRGDSGRVSELERLAHCVLLHPSYDLIPADL